MSAQKITLNTKLSVTSQCLKWIECRKVANMASSLSAKKNEQLNVTKIKQLPEKMRPKIEVVL